REATAGWVWVGLGGFASLLVPLWLLLSASFLQLDQFVDAGLGQAPDKPVTQDWLRALSGAGFSLLFAIPVGLVLGTGAALSRVAMDRRAREERDQLDASVRDAAVIGDAPVVTRGRAATGGRPTTAVVLADVPSRVLAWLVDRGLLLVAAMPLVIFHPLVRPTIGRLLTPVGDAVADGLMLVSAMLVAIVLSVQVVGLLRNGQSVGKRWFGIRIVRPNGTVPGFVSLIVVRNLVLVGLMLITMVIFLYVAPVLAVPVALLWPTIDALTWIGPDRRALHDQWADTLVVNAGMRST
ncbi:MAG: RDD family protein, partial [Myxococcota bacterium]